ncbi:MAG: ASKHA domain-containing protein [Acetivibrionales bacterium]|jgi:uncharacterized 2Fe-2S/4Fe-4S cluster protein (DUF4445 family)
MKTYSVTILPENLTVNVEKGTSLIKAVKKSGIEIESPCGRHGTCGKCAVKVINGMYDPGDQNHIPEDLKDKGFVLACQATVIGDLVLEVPHFSRLTKHKVVMGAKRTKYQKEHDYFSDNSFKPLCWKIHVDLEEPDLSNSLNDLDRLRAVMSRDYGIKDARITLKCLRELPFVIRKGNWSATVTVLCINDEYEIIDIEPGKTDMPVFGIAVDIGTTTVAASLLNLETGKVSGRSGLYNKQSIYGSDVITRTIYADENNNGLERLHNAVISSVNELVEELLTKNSLKNEDVQVMVCAGNTIMTHMLMNVSPTFLRLEPYIPAATKFPTVKAKELGIKINPEGRIVTLPSVSSYVGGDIVSGILATMINKTEELTLFIDIGTNGELVLGNKEWLVTCSCSAGPAFEGSGISCGMRAMSGAISQIDIDPESFDVTVKTLDDAPALGICGSGLIYSLSELMRTGLIDRAGKFSERIDTPRLRITNEGMEFVLVYSEESGSGKDIVITEGDIKNLIRAKGAIFAGIRTMLEQVQLSMTDIERVYIAGGFGSYLNITDSISIGLLPDLPEEKYEYIGNSSVQGAMIVLLDRDALKTAENIADMMTYIELSLGNMFMDEFISALFIPHTDLSLFPSLASKKWVSDMALV